MVGPPARLFRLSRGKRRKLERLSRSTSAPLRLVLRARIILLAASGKRSSEIAKALGCSSRVVRKWCARFLKAKKKLLSRKDQSRSGRPQVVPIEVRCTVIKVACERPGESRAPFRSVWTLRSLREAVASESGWTLSISEIRRILANEDIQPHRMRLWLHSQDPDFQSKIKPICELYLNPPKGATSFASTTRPAFRLWSARTRLSGLAQDERESSSSNTSVTALARCSPRSTHEPDTSWDNVRRIVAPTSSGASWKAWLSTILRDKSMSSGTT